MFNKGKTRTTEQLSEDIQLKLKNKKLWQLQKTQQMVSRHPQTTHKLTKMG